MAKRMKNRCQLMPSEGDDGCVFLSDDGFILFGVVVLVIFL